ncbi:MAG: HAMP domain-containing histidine kinase [Phycisphaerales bacterium]|nr:HAMP domain-containing histidine kinase [Phycisphaerales bacterium]
MFHEELVRLHRLSVLGLAAGMIAHEFNNILTPLASYAQMALAEPDDHALATKALQRCLVASEQTSRIASAILELVRSAGAPEGSSATDRSRADVFACLRTAIDCLGRSPEKDGIALTIADQSDRGAPVIAAIEPHALTHALVNLLINARNAIDRRGAMDISVAIVQTPPGADPGTIDSRCSTWNSGGGTGFGERVASRQQSSPTALQSDDACMQPGPWVVITIRDTGRGMTSDQLAQLFVPPHLRTAARGNTARREGAEVGTGLGMGITKQLIESASGWLLVGSTPGRGTTVQLIVPASRCCEHFPNT